MTLAVFALLIVGSIGVAFASRLGVKAFDVDDYLVAGRSFSGLLLFVLVVGEIYSSGRSSASPAGSTPRAPRTGSGSWATSCSRIRSATSSSR